MNSNDTDKFYGIWDRAGKYYEKKIEPDSKKLTFQLLMQYEFRDVAEALKRHMQDPDRGRFMPKAADIVAKLNISSAAQFPGAEEAWAQYPRGESQSACVTQEMHTAWGIACELDEIAGRMTFKEVYNREVAIAEAEGRKPIWKMTLGHDPHQREEATLQAIHSGRLTVDNARTHLPNYREDELQRLANNSVSVTALLMDESRQQSQDMPALIASTVTDPASQETALSELAKLQAMLGIGKKAANG